MANKSELLKTYLVPGKRVHLVGIDMEDILIDSAILERRRGVGDAAARSFA